MHGLAAILDVLQWPTTVTAVAIVVALVFAWAGVSKIRRPYLAAVAAMNLGVVHQPYREFGIALGVVESAVAVSLLFGPTTTIASMAAATLSAVFFMLVAHARANRRAFSCGCFGDPEETIGGQTLVRCGVLFGLSILLARSGAAVVGTANLNDWAQATVLVAAVGGITSLLLSLRSVMRASRTLDSELDWEWILQRLRTGGETPAFARRFTGGRP